MFAGSVFWQFKQWTTARSISHTNYNSEGEKVILFFLFSKYRRGYSRELFLTSPSPDNKWMRIEHGCLKANSAV
jgi:hypothetical protein